LLKTVKTREKDVKKTAQNRQKGPEKSVKKSIKRAKKSEKERQNPTPQERLTEVWSTFSLFRWSVNQKVICLEKARKRLFGNSG